MKRFALANFLVGWLHANSLVFFPLWSKFKKPEKVISSLKVSKGVSGSLKESRKILEMSPISSKIKKVLIVSVF